MKTKLSRLLALAPAALAVAAPMGAQAAAVDYFLKIDGIEGESTDKVHAKEIPLESFSFGVSNSASASASGGGGSGKPSFQDLSGQARISKASPLLYQFSATGTRVKSALLSARKVGSKNTVDFYTVKLEDVIISSVKTEGTTSELPTESVSFNFSKITWAYKVQKADGSFESPITRGFDLKTMKGF